jgi:hypothetical protein
MESERPDLANEIVGFIEALPITIRTDILYFVMMYALDEAPSEHHTFLPRIQDALTKTGGMKRMSATLRVAAALDYILARSVEKIRSAKNIIASAKGLSPDIVDRFSAGQPLRQKHYDIAFADWTQLRKTLITQQGLSDYEDNLLMPRLVKQDNT